MQISLALVVVGHLNKEKRSYTGTWCSSSGCNCCCIGRGSIKEEVLQQATFKWWLYRFLELVSLISCPERAERQGESCVDKSGPIKGHAFLLN